MSIRFCLQRDEFPARAHTTEVEHYILYYIILLYRLQLILNTIHNTVTYRSMICNVTLKHAFS